MGLDPKWRRPAAEASLPEEERREEKN